MAASKNVRISRMQTKRKKSIAAFSKAAISGKSPVGRVLTHEDRLELLLRSLEKRRFKEGPDKKTSLIYTPKYTSAENYLILKLLLEDPFRTIDYIYKKTRIGTLIFYFTPAHFSYLARELSRTKKVYDFFSALSKDKYRVHHFAQGLVRKNAIESFFKPLGLKDMETVARAMGHNIGDFMDGLFYVKDSDKVQIAQSFAKALTEVETTPYTRYGKVVGSRDIPKIYPFVQYMGENSRVFARELVNNDSLGIFLSGLGKEIYWLGRGLGLKSGSFAQGILGAKNSISGLSQLAFGLKDHINSFNSGLSLMLEKPGLTTLNARKLFMDRFTTQLTGYFKKYLEKQGIDSRVISRFISGY